MCEIDAGQREGRAGRKSVEIARAGLGGGESSAAARKTSRPPQEESVPDFFPSIPLVEHGDRIDRRIGKVVELALDLRACRNAAERLEQPLAGGRQHEIGEEQRRMWV